MELLSGRDRPTINTIALNPGSLLNTNMVRETFGKHWSSADKGANIIYELAILEQYENDSGKYFNNDLAGKNDGAKGGFDKAHPQAYDQVLVRSLVVKTQEILS